MKRALVALSLCLGCLGSVTTTKLKTDETTNIKADVTQETDTSSSVDTQKNKNTTVEVKKDPSVIETRESDDEFGWVMPPPGSPPDAAPEWKVVKRHGKETTRKVGAIESKKETGTSENTKAAASTDATLKDKTATDATKKVDLDQTKKVPSLIEVLLGPHWRWIVGGVLSLVGIGVIAYINPLWLGIPFRIIATILRKLRGAFGKKPDA
jgi:hypothetical protein